MSSRAHEFQFVAGNLALDFVNTVGNRLGDAREDLNSGAAFWRWARLAGFPVPPSRTALAARDLARIRAVREELHTLFLALAKGAAPSRRLMRPLNARLRAIASVRELDCSRRGVGWTWAAAGNDPRSILGDVLLSAAELLTSGAFANVRQCDGDGCGWLFVDRSPAGKRRWCSMADCGNRAKARRHYAHRAPA